MAARADVLGDDGDSAPANWESPLGTPTCIVLVMISAAAPAGARRPRSADPCERSSAPAVLTIVYRRLGSFMPDYREHFGYADGFAQPDIEGAGLPSAARRRRAAERRSVAADPRRRVHPRLPRRGERAARRADPRPALATNGSFLVYRKLHQDVAAFRAQLAPAAQLYPGGRGTARGQDRRALARRHADRPLARSSRPGRSSTDERPQQRLLVRAPTPTACAVPSVPTSAAPTRATACRSRASWSTATV